MTEPMTSNGALPGLGRRRILLIIGALMLGMLLAALATGLPESCDLRHVTDNATPNKVAERKENP